ncbi:MAG: hypothetical protein IKL25_09880 [Clostridia bacterium]|nr:hypothetical protein [Clostridia bacterium]
MIDNIELTMEQKQDACLAALYAIEKTQRGDRERAFSLVDNSIYPAYVQQEQSAMRQAAGYIGFGLQLLGKLYLRDDTPVYLLEKSAGAHAEKVCEEMKADVDIAYQAMLKYLDHIIRRMQSGDVSISSCYELLKQVADFQKCPAEVLKQIGINERIHCPERVSPVMGAMERSSEARRRYQLIVRDAFRQRISQKSEMSIEQKREKTLAALAAIVSVLQQQEKKALAREVKSLHATVIQRYDDTYAMLKEMRSQVKQSDSAVEICYYQICQVAAKRSDAATALLAMAAEMELYIRSAVRKLVESLGRYDQVMADMRDGVHGILYPAE